MARDTEKLTERINEAWQEQHTTERMEMKCRHWEEIGEACLEVQGDDPNEILRQVTSRRAKEEAERIRLQLEKFKDELEETREKENQIAEQQMEDLRKKIESEKEADRAKHGDEMRREEERFTQEKEQREKLRHQKKEEYQEELKRKMQAPGQDEPERLFNEYQTKTRHLEEQDEILRKKEKELHERRVAAKKAKQDAKKKRQDGLLKPQEGEKKEEPQLEKQNSAVIRSMQRMKQHSRSTHPVQDWVRAIMESPVFHKIQSIESTLKEMKEGGGFISYYVDPEDRKQRCEGGLKEVPLESLPKAERGVFLYAQGILKKVQSEVGSTMPAVELKVASSLPEPSGSHTAFRNSFAWNPTTSSLYLRDTRLKNVGKCVMVLTHSLAHIMADTVNGGNDASPKFMHCFYGLMELLSEEMCSSTTKTPLAERKSFKNFHQADL